MPENASQNSEDFLASAERREKEEEQMYISINEYAIRNGKAPVSVRQKAERGKFHTAKKIGRVWVIDENEPWSEGSRISSGSEVAKEKEKNPNSSITQMAQNEKSEND